MSLTRVPVEFRRLAANSRQTRPTFNAAIFSKNPENKRNFHENNALLTVPRPGPSRPDLLSTYVELKTHLSLYSSFKEEIQDKSINRRLT